jgi:hypothetical protein
MASTTAISPVLRPGDPMYARHPSQNRGNFAAGSSSMDTRQRLHRRVGRRNSTNLRRSLVHSAAGRVMLLMMHPGSVMAPSAVVATASGGLNDWSVRGVLTQDLGQGADGAQEGNRTPDLRITSALLYRLSYLGRNAILPRPDWSSSGAADRPGNCG